MDLDLSTRQEGAATVVSLAGRMTLGHQLVSAENKLKAAFEAGGAKIVLDLAGLDYLDSAGIGLLMMCAGTARNNNGQFHVAAPNERVKKIFDIAHVGKALAVYPDVASAVAAFS